MNGNKNWFYGKYCETVVIVGCCENEVTLGIKDGGLWRWKLAHFPSMEFFGHGIGPMNESEFLQVAAENMDQIVEMVHNLNKPTLLIEDKGWYNKMDPWSKHWWLAAMRRPDYKRCHHVIREGDDHYCPMGALMKLDGGEWHLDANTGRWFYRAHFDRFFSNGSPSDEFLRRMRIDRRAANVIMSMNDGIKSEGIPPSTTEEICQWIENNI